MEIETIRLPSVARIFLANYGLMVVLFFLLATFSLMAPSFLSVSTGINIARQVATIGVCAVGMTIVMIGGGVDFSIGSLVGLVNIVCAKLIVEQNYHPLAAVIICLVLAVGVGAINGFWIVVLKIPPLITTLAMLTSMRGLSYVLSGGRPIWGFGARFRLIGRGQIFGLPIPMLIMLGTFFLGWFFLTRTRYGRYIYGMGGSESAAVRSGVNVIRMKFLIYCICSFTAALAGIMVLARLNTGLPATGTGLEMEVVTAVVLGGVSIYGGKGSIFGVLLGVLIMGVLANGMIYLNVTEYLQLVIRGVVLLVAIGIGNVANGQRPVTDPR